MAQALVGVALLMCLATTALYAAPAGKGAGPTWNQLTQEQQQILAPIEGEWNKLEPQRKRKWLGIAKRYPKMKPESQARLQQRMRDWASLTPDERRAARSKYRQFEQLDPKERRAVREKWEQYKRERDAQAAHKAPPESTPETASPGLTGARP